MHIFWHMSLYSEGLLEGAPLLLAALAGLLCALVNVFNIGLEGLMICGAFAAVVGSWFMGNAWLGVVVGTSAGALLGVLFGYVVVYLRANEIVAGLGINIFALGATAFLLTPVFGVTGTFYSASLASIGPLPLGPIARVPVLGPLLNGESPLFFLAILLVPVIGFCLKRTKSGLRVRAVGQNPTAAQSLGAPPRKTQMMVFLASGALCGLAGAQLALAQTTEFTEGMTAGRGYIALVALLVAGTNVWAVAGVAIAFGILQSVSSQLQSLGVASQLIEAIPFVLGFIALVGVHLAQTLARTRRTKVALAVSMRTYGDGRSHADISVVDARPGGPPSAR